MSPFLSGALGALTVLLVAGLVRRALWHRRFRHGPRGRAWFARRLFRRLRTRPEQEAVLSAELEAIATELRGLRQDARAVRGDLAELLGAPALDAAAVAARLEPGLGRLQAVKDRLAAGVARVHATLDPAQRAELVALLRCGPHGLRGHAHHA